MEVIVNKVLLSGRYKTLEKQLAKDDITIQEWKKDIVLCRFTRKSLKRLLIPISKKYQKEKFKPTISYATVLGARGDKTHIVIIQNTADLIELSKKRHKSKDYYCKVIITGLSKKIDSKASKIISKILERKAFSFWELEYQ